MSCSSGIIASKKLVVPPPPAGVPSNAVSVPLSQIFLAVVDSSSTFPVSVNDWPVGATFANKNPKVPTNSSYLLTTYVNSLRDFLPPVAQQIDLWIYLTFIANGPYVGRVLTGGLNGTPTDSPTLDSVTSILLKVNNGGARSDQHSLLQGAFGAYNSSANWISYTIAYMGWTPRP